MKNGYRLLSLPQGQERRCSHRTPVQRACLPLAQDRCERKGTTDWRDPFFDGSKEQC